MAILEMANSVCIETYKKKTELAQKLANNKKVIILTQSGRYSGNIFYSRIGPFHQDSR